MDTTSFETFTGKMGVIDFDANTVEIADTLKPSPITSWYEFLLVDGEPINAIKAGPHFILVADYATLIGKREARERCKVAAAIPGLAELRGAVEAVAAFSASFDEALGDDMGAGARLLGTPHADISALRCQYPHAWEYLNAERAASSRNAGQITAGRLAMDMLLEGGELALARARLALLIGDWEAHASTHATAGTKLAEHFGVEPIAVAA